MVATDHGPTGFERQRRGGGGVSPLVGSGVHVHVSLLSEKLVCVLPSMCGCLLAEVERDCWTCPVTAIWNCWHKSGDFSSNQPDARIRV